MATSNSDFLIKSTSEITAKRVLEKLNAETRGFKGSVVLVDERTAISKAINDLKMHTELAIDCEGVRLGRGGKLTLVQVGAKNNTTYLFDVLKLGIFVFESGLKEILESPNIVKYVFDCRNDSDSLWHEYQVKLSNVLDMQLLEFLCRPGAGTKMRGPSKPWHYRKPVVRGMNDAVSRYVNTARLHDVGLINFETIKETGGRLMNTERTIWRYRPMSNGLKVYASLDIIMIWAISEALQEYQPLVDITKERVKVASERYASVRRDHDTIEPLYMRTPLLLSHIIPDVDGQRLAPFTTGDGKCTGCKRYVVKKGSLCFDCKEIERVSAARR